MPKTAPARRLEFQTLEQAVEEAEHLSQNGYDQTGRWNLANVCHHCEIWLASTFRNPIRPPLIGRPVLAVVRHTIGPGMLRRVLESGRMPSGSPTVPSTDPVAAKPPSEASSEANDASAIASLRKTIKAFDEHEGLILPSPLFGAMTRDQADQLHRIHLAHHLGYLVPKT